jgi:hypothetical protein
MPEYLATVKVTEEIEQQVGLFAEDSLEGAKASVEQHVQCPHRHDHKPSWLETSHISWILMCGGVNTGGRVVKVGDQP